MKVVRDVDKDGFVRVAGPLQDTIATGLGPHAVEILQIIRTIE